MIGGLGPCGRQICCGAFLDEFQPVSIKMAKEQNLSLNPTKISGVCGRLMCCLKYEQEHYEQTRKIMPRIGREVVTPDGNGTVSDLNIVKETVFVRIANGDTSEIKEYPLDKIEKPGQNAPQQSAGQQENTPGTSDKPDSSENNGNDGASCIHAKEEQNSSESNKSGSEKETRETAFRRGGKNRGKFHDRNREDRQKHLGKPVMRENPNRPKPALNNIPSESNNTPEKRRTETDIPEEKSSGNQEKAASSWSEAVKKAMDSIR